MNQVLSILSCIYQLLPASLGIHQSFDNSFEVRAIFLDISKAFDKALCDK